MKLTLQQLEAHLWGAANILRGKTAGQDYKNYILSLMFYKRLCDQWEREADDAIADLERQQGRAFSEKEKAVFRKRGEHRFKIPDGSRWGDVKATSTNIGAVLTKAMRAVANANDELRGVFTVDWDQPAPDGSGRPLIPNEVVHALIQHFDEHDLSNKSVPSDILGRAYEYLIKQFADDAGAKAGEFFTPPEVVDTLVRILQPRPDDTVYDPTSGSGGMLVHTADYLREHGHHASSARYFAQEMNWGNAAIGKINSVLHGLDADIKAGASTITDPQFLEDGRVRKFSLVLANFPFSDEFWWLKPEQQTDDKKKKEKLKKEIFRKEGFKDPFGRFGRGTPFRAPPAGYGDYAFILHILASLSEDGRAGIVCPQGILFRGQPEVEEETGEFDDDGKPKMRRRKADDEHLIRNALLKSGIIDAIISLPLNIFYGAGVPACLLILRKQRHVDRRDKVLLLYAARHFRELSAQNELRPQDVMRILVHYQAYGDGAKVPALVAEHSGRIRKQIDLREADEVGRLEAEYQPYQELMTTLDHEITLTEGERDSAENGARKLPEEEKVAALRGELSLLRQTALSQLTARERQKLEKNIQQLETKQQRLVSAITKKRKKASANAESRLVTIRGQLAAAQAKLAERDERIVEARRRAEDDRNDVSIVCEELIALYSDPDELIKHARVVSLAEIEENEFNLNIPRYVDTFEPEPQLEVTEVLKALRMAEEAARDAETELKSLLTEFELAQKSDVDA